MFWNDIKEIKERLERVEEKIDLLDEEDFCSDDYDLLDEVNCKLNRLLNDDKIEDYMKNIDKLNDLVNEFKGFVAISRAALKGSTKEKKKRSPSTKNSIKT